MTENTTENNAPELEIVETSDEVELTRLQRFVLKHPRAAKVVAITGAATAVAGVAITANTVRKNKHHLDQAADHAKDAFHEVSESVSPTDTDN